MLHDGKEAGAVGEVAGEFPDHRATEFLRVDVIAFRADRLAVVVADEETSLARWGIDPGHLGCGIPESAVDCGLGGEAFRSMGSELDKSSSSLSLVSTIGVIWTFVLKMIFVDLLVAAASITGTSDFSSMTLFNIDRFLLKICRPRAMTA